ncbi:hypothetical protein [Brazilian marseillevirus]|uniref:hypothetical protein n=1 Tax=Brazilian marseillevirus TaxID=1813599 RepID=UPI000781CCB6|nr:hypothetical protein A3303_gp309 [Brazilian marseillevirus]AMQ10817.1 hypothetical protein [Brazilian marseillevirus]
MPVRVCVVECNDNLLSLKGQNLGIVCQFLQKRVRITADILTLCSVESEIDSARVCRDVVNAKGRKLSDPFLFVIDSDGKDETPVSLLKERRDILVREPRRMTELKAEARKVLVFLEGCICLPESFPVFSGVDEFGRKLEEKSLESSFQNADDVPEPWERLVKIQKFLGVSHEFVDLDNVFVTRLIGSFPPILQGLFRWSSVVSRVYLKSGKLRRVDSEPILLANCMAVEAFKTFRNLPKIVVVTRSANENITSGGAGGWQRRKVGFLSMCCTKE